ncbi:hydroxyethylthiazole kinase [Thermodesulfobacteriota bacterium]
MEYFSEKAAQNLAALRDKKPLIHTITNYVTMNFVANALLAMGASPVMAHCDAEVEEIVSSADALVLNIGTLNKEWMPGMIAAGKKATTHKKPIVVDPVGCGATKHRTRFAQKIIAETKPAVIRGNPSEILSLEHPDFKTRGVDSVHPVEEAAAPAQRLAGHLGITLAITGAFDWITDGKRGVRVENGHPLMGRVTGTGCAATAVIAAFLAIDDDPLSAASTAMAFLGLAGEVAGKKASAPGSFMIEMLNALYTITPDALKDGCKIEE